MMKTRSISSLVSAFLIVACSGGDTTGPGEAVPVPTTVSLSATSLRFASLGDTQQLQVTVRDQNGNVMSGEAIGWASSDGSVASVSRNGTVTAVANGSATITAVVSAASASATVTVSQVAASVSLDQDAVSFATLGDTVRLTATGLDAGGAQLTSPQVEWSSSDETVAAVDGDGLITAVANGSATVTATIGSSSSGASVTVSQVETSLSLAPEALTFSSLGDTARLTGTVFDAGGNRVPNAVTTWSSTEPNVATVDENGLVTAVANGTARVVGSAGTAADTVEIQVEQMVSTVAVSPIGVTLAALDDTVRIAAEALDANGYAVAGQSFTWSSLDPSIASVDRNGLVTATGPGEASITAATAGVSGNLTVSVVQVPASVVLSLAADTLIALGDTARVGASVRDANGFEISGADVAWESSASGVATVDQSGLVTAISQGTAMITASSGSAQATIDVFVEVATRIVFASDYQGNWELYSILSNGSNLVRLTQTTASEQWPVISSDGQRIAYTAGTNIYVMNIDGTNNERVTWTGISSTDPSWSPDGDALVITHRSCGGCVPRPHILTLSTGALSELPIGGSNPSWSHGDSLIASSWGDNIEVNAISSTTPNQIVVLQESARNPRFSPAGDRIVFHGDDVQDGANYPRVFAVDIDGANLTMITTDNTNASNPTWSPDGTRIAFSRGGNLWTMSANGSELRQITFFPPGNGLMPSWYN